MRNTWLKPAGMFLALVLSTMALSGCASRSSENDLWKAVKYTEQNR